MIDTIELPPLLAENKEVLNLAKQANEAEALYIQKVSMIRAACSHAIVIKTWQYPNKVFLSEKGALLSTNCADCGLVQKKPDGMPWKVCQVCWASMADEGHGLVGEDRTHFYKCTKCSHTYSHT